ncbi:signal peptidase I [Enterococcus sp. 669A]|uniref:Signal peptidase I n=1 Tax=Candidatus Enterococcus moelleringii TaxID=2815325 RepID=A0ABS3L922_9ENTE|nr:signal peptidase I [Enterococcus sp. 669A]MBO1306129.1 signal peptidase I [Enterococcus sp. 669A]
MSRHHSPTVIDKRRKILKGLIIVCLIALCIEVGYFLNLQLREHFSIHWVSGTSMEQNLEDGDAVLVRKDIAIKRYEVIAFKLPEESEMFVKRVVGMPGDAIIIRNNRMVLNIGAPENFETVYTFQINAPVAKELQALTSIPEDSYFVIGDHVDVSKDSRTFGFVKKEQIEGTVQFHLANIH